MESFDEMLKDTEEHGPTLENNLNTTFTNDGNRKDVSSKRKIDEDEYANKPHEVENKKNMKRNNLKTSRKKQEENDSLHILCEIFLRILYPLSVVSNKNATVGFCKYLDYSPGVLLNHGGRQITFNKDSWKSLCRCLPLIHCYLVNKVFGKKTKITIDYSDIEIDNIKVRGELFVRFRNLSSYDTKILLNRNEFDILNYSMPAIDRYMQQLQLSGSTIKEYLVGTIENSEDTHLVFGSTNNSIYNRLPEEVFLYRTIKSLEPQNEIPVLEPICDISEDETMIKFKCEESDQPLDLRNGQSTSNCNSAN